VQGIIQVMLNYTRWKCRFREPAGQRRNNAAVRRGRVIDVGEGREEGRYSKTVERLTVRAR